MRVAIYAQARSGSTALFNYIKDSLSLKGILEPYNPKFPERFTEEEIWKQDNIVVKFLLRDKNIVEKLPLVFDKVIYLTRSNDLEGAESLVYATKKDIWHEPYEYSTLKDSFSDEEIKDKRNKRAQHRKYIESQKGFQITYEEIFYERVGIPKINDYIGIKTNRYIHLLDIKNKYRVNKADAKPTI